MIQLIVPYDLGKQFAESNASAGSSAVAFYQVL